MTLAPAGNAIIHAVKHTLVDTVRVVHGLKQEGRGSAEKISLRTSW
jgi:hypothetical protein